jgi:CRISPR/Cas system-associated exonuclease Cas4 (RecB family)
MYYCRHILGLEIPQAGYDSRKAGICLHRLWEKSWRTYLESGGSLTGISMSLLDETMKEYYPDLCSDPFLGRYLARFRGLIRKGGQIQDRMEETGLRSDTLPPIMEGWLPELEINGVRFRGRFDRLDPILSEKGVLIDYKSGKSTAYRKNMQLAAYCTALAKGDPERKVFSGTISGYAYICSSDGKVTGSALDSDTAGYLGLSSRYLDLEEKMEKAEEHMASMAENIMEGNFSPNYDSSYCSYCSFSGICRRQEKPEGEDLDDNDR